MGNRSKKYKTKQKQLKNIEHALLKNARTQEKFSKLIDEMESHIVPFIKLVVFYNKLNCFKKFLFLLGFKFKKPLDKGE